MNLMASLTKRFEIPNNIIVTILVFVMDKQMKFRPATLAAIFFELAVCLYAPFPNRIGITYAKDSFAFFGLDNCETFPRTGNSARSRGNAFKSMPAVFTGHVKIDPVFSGHRCFTLATAATIFADSLHVGLGRIDRTANYTG